MQKLLLLVGGSLLLFYSCQGGGQNESLIDNQITKDSIIIFPRCLLKIDTLAPNEDILDKHLIKISNYITDSIPRKYKRDFLGKKYYFHFSINIEERLLRKYNRNIYMDYINELTKIFHLPMGLVNGRPIADTYFSYHSLNTEKNDSSFIEITVKQNLCK